jgi:hypothetical protein
MIDERARARHTVQHVRFMPAAVKRAIIHEIDADNPMRALNVLGLWMLAENVAAICVALAVLRWCHL